MTSLLQADLKSLEVWSERWQLKFNPDKCKVIHIGHKFRTCYKISDNGVDKFLEDVWGEGLRSVCYIGHEAHYPVYQGSKLSTVRSKDD